MRKFLVGAAVAAAASVATLSVASPASADVTDTWLRVDGPGGVVTLTCDPAGGTHPYAQQACDEIAKADGVIADVPPLPAVCPMYVDPTPVSVIGIWHGRQIVFRETELNPPCAKISHGHIFDYNATPVSTHP